MDPFQPPQFAPVATVEPDGFVRLCFRGNAYEPVLRLPPDVARAVADAVNSSTFRALILAPSAAQILAADVEALAAELDQFEDLDQVEGLDPRPAVVDVSGSGPELR